jgi:hypothetical protein
MADSKCYKYFERKSSEWNITDFLDKCDLEPYEKKIDCYVKCLTTIAESEDGFKRDKARLLLSRFQEVNIRELDCGVRGNDDSDLFGSPSSRQS